MAVHDLPDFYRGMRNIKTYYHDVDTTKQHVILIEDNKNRGGQLIAIMFYSDGELNGQGGEHLIKLDDKFVFWTNNAEINESFGHGTDIMGMQIYDTTNWEFSGYIAIPFRYNYYFGYKYRQADAAITAIKVILAIDTPNPEEIEGGTDYPYTGTSGWEDW